MRRQLSHTKAQPVCHCRIVAACVQQSYQAYSHNEQCEALPWVVEKATFWRWGCR